jgi:hypothetical protein
MNRRHDGNHPGAVPPTLKRARERLARLPAQARIALLAALVSLLFGFLIAIPPGIPAHAAPARPQLPSCNGPCISIANPLYPLEGQLVAEGPVGTILTIEGNYWPSSTTITIWPAPDAATCTAQLAQPPDFAGQIQVGFGGVVQGQHYTWPKAANNVNQTYILCAVDGATTIPANIQSNGITTFTVLAADAPSVTATPTSITQGQDNTTLTVSGQNWLPAPQTVIVTVCSDPNHCQDSSIASQITLSSSQYGTFQITLSIKASTDPGVYFVQAVSSGNQGALQAPPSDKPVKVTVSTPTPTPTATPSPTPTPTPTPTRPNNGKGNTTLLIVLLGMFSLLFLVGGIVSIAIYMRSGT